MTCKPGDGMTALVTGGGGYIGSHMVRCLTELGREVVVVDDLSGGHRDAVPASVPFYVANIADGERMKRILREHRVEAVFHFASRIQVGESVVNPRLYYDNNLAASITLAGAALDSGVRSFILSSTAAVYGTPTAVPIVEDASTSPINPYGETKLAIERMLAAYSRAYGLSFAALRYFNAAGAYPEAGLGERHAGESHLIPIVLAAALGQRRDVTVFGRDYPTPDGTCVRDYVHVRDLAEAHLAALDHLERGGASGAWNLGTGTGYSVGEVIDVCRAITGREIRVVDAPRRAGDPPSLVASARRAELTLGWKARFSSLERIISDAWSFHRARLDSESNHAPLARQPKEIAHAR